MLKSVPFRESTPKDDLLSALFVLPGQARDALCPHDCHLRPRFRLGGSRGPIHSKADTRAGKLSVPAAIWPPAKIDLGTWIDISSAVLALLVVVWHNLHSPTRSRRTQPMTVLARAAGSRDSSPGAAHCLRDATTPRCSAILPGCDSSLCSAAFASFISA